MGKKESCKYRCQVGNGTPGPRNQITDVKGVLVGHCTIDNEENKTGVTAIIPGAGNIYENKFVAASFVLNGFGKTCGLVQIDELGTLETPIMLTNTLNIGLVQDAVVDYMIERCDPTILTLNPVVCECNDSRLNNIQKRAIKREHVYEALEQASEEFEEGAVGAGMGTICFGLKGGIGSSSRVIELDSKEFTVGALVQTNHGKTSDLTINGKRIGHEIELNHPSECDKGSIIIIVATDLPVTDRQLRRIIKRASIGLIRTGSHLGHGSGDIIIGFSTANRVTFAKEQTFATMTYLREDKLELAFRAVAGAVEEAILHSMLAAKTVTGVKHNIVHSISEFITEESYQ